LGFVCFSGKNDIPLREIKRNVSLFSWRKCVFAHFSSSSSSSPFFLYNLACALNMLNDGDNHSDSEQKSVCTTNKRFSFLTVFIV